MTDDNAIKEALINTGIEDCDSATLLAHRFQQYSIYLQMADKVSERRQNANTYFLTINTGVCVAIGYLFSKDGATELKPLFWLIPTAGMILSYFWMTLVNSYKQLNSGKFRIIHLLETSLPLSPYSAEWIVLAEGKNKKVYQPLAHVEIWVPRLFIAVYSVLIMYFIYKSIRR